MTIFIIPENAGPYEIIRSMAGTPLVMNKLTGKRKVRIACKTWEQAEQICQRLNDGDHDGTIRA
ncbi:MAG: hypothetical protein KDA66_08580 [Planctomycetaceae bacterium]|nr:hypothetical protein [Planctomycetaceae bacterium]MCB9951058.1 hypothetical protein [Planctomycetaceae bacterium]